MSASDPTSLLIVVIGEAIFLILLLPAVLQYSRSRKLEGPHGEGGDSMKNRWIARRVLAVAVMLGLAIVPTTSAPQERIVNRQDADRFFGLSRTQWEAEAREMVESQGWKVRPTPGDTGTSVMTMDPKTGVGLGVRPVFRDPYGPPVTLVVGSYYPAGTFRRFSEQAQRDLEAAVSTNLGSPYSVSVSFSTQIVPPPGFDIVELVITRSRQ
jgi:hypothetical protein